MTFRDENKILDQIYEKLIRFLLWKLKYSIITYENENLHKSKLNPIFKVYRLRVLLYRAKLPSHGVVK